MKKNITIIILSIIVAVLSIYIVYDRLTYHNNNDTAADDMCPVK